MWHRTLPVIRSGARNIFGYSLVVIGIAGLLLPVLPGTPFLIAAVAVLGADHPVIRPWKERVNRWIKKDPIAKEKNQ